MTISESDYLNLSTEAKGRQAVRSMGGYVYQLYRSLFAWLSLGEDEILLLEVAEDLAILRDELVIQTQIKDDKQSGNLTLRSASVISLINSHWDLQKSNPAKRIQSALITTASFGKENQLEFPNNLCGLDYWRISARANADISPIRDALLAINIEPEVKQFVEKSSNEELRTLLIQPITWIANSDQLPLLRLSIKDSLVRLGEKFQILSPDAEKAEHALLGAIIEVILYKPDRQVNRVDLLRHFSDAVSVSMPIQAVQQMAMAGTLFGAPTAFLPGTATISTVENFSISPRIAERNNAVSELSNICAQSGFLWLHGSSGLGKTTLAIQIARRSTAEDWIMVDLRDCDPTDVKIRLYLAARQLIDRNLRGVILDDFPAEQSSNTIFKLSQFVYEATLADAIVIATSYYEPTPQLISSFKKNAIKIKAVPYLSEHDVGELISSEKGNPEIWATPIHTFCGLGHPQLVNACILGLSSRGWKESDIFEEVVSPGPGTETRKQQDAVLRRLLTELPDHIRTLLYRLSILMPGFDESIAMSVSCSVPTIERAKESFVYLCGPWIENRGKDKFSVSPLVRNSAKDNLAPSEASSVRQSVINNLIQRKPFPLEQLSQLFLNSLIEKSREGFLYFSRLMLSNATDRQTFATLSHEVSSFSTLSSKRGEILFPEDLHLSAMLRIVQCLVAISRHSENRSEIFELMLTECNHVEHTELAAGLLITGIFLVLRDNDADISPLLWLNALSLIEISFEILTQLNVLPSRPMQDEEIQVQQLLFATQATSLKSIKALEELFQHLSSMDASLRNYYLIGLDHLDNTRLMIDNSWANESKFDSLDVDYAVKTFTKLSEISSGWGRDDVAIYCLCAQVVMLDEYQNNSEEAHRQLNAHLDKFPNNRFLLRRMQTYYFRSEKYQECLEVYERLSKTWSQGDEFDALFSTRDAARSAVELGNLQKAAELFEKGHHLAIDAGDLYIVFAASFLGDCSVAHFLLGNKKKALGYLMSSLIESERINENNGLQAKYCLSILPHVVAWMAQENSSQPNTKFIMKPGLCSDPNPDEYYNERPVVPNIAVWYRLAELENEFGLKVGAGKILREKLDGLTFLYLEITLSRSEIGSACLRHDVKSLINELPRHLFLLEKLMSLPQENSLDVIFAETVLVKPVDSSRWQEPQFFDEFRFAVLAFAVCSFCDGNDSALNDLIIELKKIMPLDSSCVFFLSLLESEEDELVNGDLFNLAATSLARTRKLKGDLNPEQAFLVTLYLALWLNQSGYHDYIAEPIVKYYYGVWNEICDAKRFLLNTPNVFVPNIKEICNGSEFTGSAFAKLCLVLDNSTAYTLPSDLLQKLKSFAII